MAQEKPSQFPEPIQSLADTDYLLLSQRDNSTNLWVSVKITALQLKEYLASVAP